jgi:hypothetical protein
MQRIAYIGIDGHQGKQTTMYRERRGHLTKRNIYCALLGNYLCSKKPKHHASNAESVSHLIVSNFPFLLLAPLQLMRVS